MTSYHLLFVFVLGLIQTVYGQDYSLQFLHTYSELNGPCKTIRDCRSFGYVCKNNKTCDCSEFYKVDTYKKQCVGGVDQKCVYDEHCIEGAFCMNQELCKCKESTPVILDDGMVCARSSMPDICTSCLYLMLVVITTVF